MSATIDIQNDIALIRMDDGKANAINFEMVAALNEALDKAEAALGLLREPHNAQQAQRHSQRHAHCSNRQHRHAPRLQRR